MRADDKLVNETLKLDPSIPKLVEIMAATSQVRRLQQSSEKVFGAGVITIIVFGILLAIVFFIARALRPQIAV